jgi:hypothetical protein
MDSFSRTDIRPNRDMSVHRDDEHTLTNLVRIQPVEYKRAWLELVAAGCCKTRDTYCGSGRHRLRCRERGASGKTIWREPSLPLRGREAPALNPADQRAIPHLHSCSPTAPSRPRRDHRRLLRRLEQPPLRIQTHSLPLLLSLASKGQRLIRRV